MAVEQQGRRHLHHHRRRSRQQSGQGADHRRGERSDDKDIETFRTRLKEFRTKTLPVVQHYKELGLLIEVKGNLPRDEVFADIVEKLYAKATSA